MSEQKPHFMFSKDERWELFVKQSTILCLKNKIDKLRRDGWLDCLEIDHPELSEWIEDLHYFFGMKAWERLDWDMNQARIIYEWIEEDMANYQDNHQSSNA